MRTSFSARRSVPRPPWRSAARSVFRSGRRALAGAAGVLVLSACGGADDGTSGGSDEGAGGEGTAQSSEQGSGPSRSADDGSSAPPEQAAEVAPADLANFECARQGDGRWKATGDVVNPTGQPMVYTVTVVTVDGEDEVVGERVDSFEIGPDDRASFTWPKFFRGSAEACMPHVEREPA